jgi:ketosteroid isomerase-like protein
MNITFRLLTIMLLVISFSLFASAQDSGDLKKKMQEMNDELIKALINDDWQSAISMYTDDIVSMPSYEPMIKGKEAIMKREQKSKEAGFKINEMSLNTLGVYSGGNLACEIGTYSINMTIPGMPEAWNDNGKYLTIWEKQPDGSWKIKIETWNTDNNPWMDISMPEGEYDDDEDGD